MVGSFVKKLLHPVRVLAGKFVLPDQSSLVGPHGCIYAAASFVTWNQIEGDYLEFGTYQGESFAAAYRALEKSRREHANAQTAATKASPEYQAWARNPPRFIAFDSFEGLPPGDAPRHVDYDPGAYGCSEPEFRANIAKAGVDLSRVITVPGFYDRSLTAEARARHGLKKAAIVMIDCDLYESTVPVLNFLTDLVGQGTILIFHDWFRFKGRPDHGEQRACREWLARNPHLELIDHWRQGPQAVSFLVNLK
jgi:hypothetical protein